MAKMCPEKPVNLDPASLEDRIFVALSQLSDEYYVFHSLVIVTNSEGALRESETDFVIFHQTKGLMVIEAKAGHVKCIKGEWYYGSGKKMDRGGPYRQADLNKWKLQKYFEHKNILSLWEKIKPIHAVWFPSIDRNYFSSINFPTDGDRAITLTRESLDNAQQEIDRIFDIPLASGVEQHLTKDEFRRIIESVLCPSFDLVPSIASDLSLKNSAFNRLLNEQSNILNFLEEQPFAVINGAAGTGKTMIALEKARRHANDGDRVLFLCFNRLLCDYFRANHSHNNIVYYTIDALACSLCNTETSDYNLLKEKLEELYFSGQFPFKHVIIDEGQDFGKERIEEASIIGLLEDIVLSEEINGTFYLFYDKNQLVQGYKIPKYILESDCKLTLYRNCRNTENIAITSMRPLGDSCRPKMFSGCVKGDSPFIVISDNQEKQIEFIDALLQYYRDLKLDNVVILTCATEDKSVLTGHCKDGFYVYKNKSYRFTTCRKFKGLEADAVIIVDVNKYVLNDDTHFDFYVGSSRAKFYLSIICNMTNEDCVETIKELDGSVVSEKKCKKKLAALLNSQLVISQDFSEERE
jgi:hypothetical protein